jgi:hypothetical protein
MKRRCADRESSGSWRELHVAFGFGGRPQLTFWLLKAVENRKKSKFDPDWCLLAVGAMHQRGCSYISRSSAASQVPRSIARPSGPAGGAGAAVGATVSAGVST